MLLACGMARAANEPVVVDGSYDSRLATLESELSCLKTQLLQQSEIGGTTGCGSSDGCCRESRGGLDAGFAFVFAKAHYKESFEAMVISPLNTTDLLPFSFDYAATPRTWLGYETANGLGVRATYWQYDQDARPLTVTPPPGGQAVAETLTVILPANIAAVAPGDVLRVENRLELQTLDVEGTVRLPIGSACVLGSGGLRYARLMQSTRAAVDNAAGAVTQRLDCSRFFEGVGPTGAAELHLPLGTTGIDLIGNVRGAFLFGNKNLTEAGTPPAPPMNALYHADDITAMGMIELGAEYNLRLSGGRSLFVRGTYEGQLWTDAGSPTLTFLGFDGFSVGFGLTY